MMASLDKSHAKFFKKLGLRLRELRISRGLTLEDTEEHGIKSWKHLQRIEAGEANITMQTLLLLSRVYRIHPADILKDL